MSMFDPGQLREEASFEPDPVHTGPVTKQTQIIAIYGKGGSGKSFALANLSYMMAQQGKRVLLIGCDPKSDTTSLLFGGKSTPTIIETSSKKKLAGEEIGIEDVCFQRDGVFAMELGGPEVGRGCGGRGIIHGFETLEKLGFHEWGFDYVLLDFLGDVVCGGFGLPIARDMCQKVIVVASNDLQSLYVANNVCKAVEYFRKMGGNVGVAGMILNKDDGTGEANAFAEAVGIPILCAIPANEDIRKKSANYQIIGKPGGQWASLFEELAVNVAEAPPLRPTPLDQDGLLNLFSADVTGADVVVPYDKQTIKGAPRERLMAFYQKWYRPDQMAVVVVGDLDPAEAEKLVRARFDSIPRPSTPAENVDRSVPSHADALFSVATDPESQGWTVLGVTPSPITGPEGNVEFLLGAVKNG